MAFLKILDFILIIDFGVTRPFCVLLY